MKKDEKVIAVFIAYNSAQTLKEFYRAFPKELCDEIILVDDNSKDNTFQIAQNLGIKSYQNPKNLGYGGNLKRAITLALQHGANIIIDIHPDGEYKPSAILPALYEIESGAELVLGNRFSSTTGVLKNGMYVWRILPLFFLNWIDKLILGLPIDDIHQGFRVYTRQLLEKINYQANSNNYIFSFELIAQAVFYKRRLSQVPVEVHYSGKKRGASFHHSAEYFLMTFGVLFLFALAKMGYVSDIFKTPISTPRNPDPKI